MTISGAAKGEATDLDDLHDDTETANALVPRVLTCQVLDANRNYPAARGAGFLNGPPLALPLFSRLLLILPTDCSSIAQVQRPVLINLGSLQRQTRVAP